MKSFRPPHFAIPTYRSYFQTLSPGDKAVFLLLLGIGIFLVLASLYALERQFLVEVPAYGGSIREGVVGTPRFVNPLLALSDADRDLTALTYAGLMGHDKNGALTPLLAERYEISPDQKTYTFTLRKKVVFHDGTPITAEDVVFTVEKAQDASLKSPQYADWANIRVEAVDARTVRFTLPKPYGPFLEDTTLGILPSHLWRKVGNEAFPFSPYTEKPVGAGPFKVERVERDANGVVQSYTLRAFSGYATGRPYLDSIKILFFKSEEEIKKAYADGRIESVHSIVTPHAKSVPYTRVFGVFFNTSKNPALARSEVREALSIAVDRNALVRDVLGGYGVPAYGPVPPSMLYASSTPVEKRTVEDARALLQKNGWKYDEQEHVWKNAKAKLTLTLTLKTSNVPELKAIADAIKSNGETLGVPIALELYTPAALVSDVLRPRNYDALLFGMVIGRDRDLFAFWDSSQRTDPGLNISLYANRKADALLETIRSRALETENQKDLVVLNSLIAAEYPAVFTHAPTFLYTLPPDVRGVVLNHIAAPTDRFLTVASWYRKSEMVWPAFVGYRFTPQ